MTPCLARRILARMTKPIFFATPAAWRAWLEKNHALATEVLVGFYKRGSKRPTITWPESVDEALCFGWIDGKRRSLDAERYTIRFSPRAARSTWSSVNIKRIGELDKLGLVHAAGRAAYAARDAKRSAIYSYEARYRAVFDAESERRFRANDAAWSFFAAQAPWYRRTATHWATSAKREATRRARLDMLIAHSAAGRRIPPLDRTMPSTRAAGRPRRGRA